VPMLYVCSVSEHNVPSLQAVLLHQPSHVLLIVSKPFKDAAQRLQAVLERTLPGLCVSRPEPVPPLLELEGDDVLDTQRWLHEVLLPYMQRPELAHLPKHLNLTGGTKAMAVALVACRRWDGLDYKGLSAMHLQVLRPPAASGDPFELHASPELADPSPLDVAELYNPHIQTLKPNPIIQQHEALSAELAGDLWLAQSERHAGLEALLEAFERVWVLGKDQNAYQCAQATIDLQPPSVDPAPTGRTLADWVQRFDALCPGVLALQQRQLTLPGNRTSKAHEHWKRWVSGDWLEQLCQLWLRDLGLPNSAIVGNLKVGESAHQSATQREADVFVHYRSQSYLIETKAGLPPDTKASDMEKQISSLAGRLGKVNKVLLLAPSLMHSLQQDNRWDGFKLRCSSNNVQSVISQLDLQKLLRL